MKRPVEAGRRRWLATAGVLLPVLALAAAAAAPLAAAPPAAAPDPRPWLERRLAAERSLVAELLTGAQLAATAPGLSADARATIERLEREATALVKAGRDGDASRSCYRAMALGLGRDWNARDEYARSLALRARPTVTDAGDAVMVELTQQFATDYSAANLLAARATLRRTKRDETHTGAARDRASATPDAAARDLGSFDSIASDLVRWPWAFAVATSDLEEGRYTVELEVVESGATIRRLAAPLQLVRGLERARAEVERRMRGVEGSAGTLASVRYPFELITLINLGRVEPRDIDHRAAIDRSLSLLARLEQGEDPLYRAVGDLARHYELAAAGEIMPYRLIVPESYDGAKSFPLVIALHGRGGNEDTMAMRPSGIMQSLARRHGYIVASPMGYRPDGGYGGVTAALPFAGPARIRASALSEQDVLEVIDRVLAEYRIDPDRIYLVGHSGGGGGVYRLASKFPDRWAAIAPIATLNTLEMEELERMRHLPVHVSHGDADLLAPVATRAPWSSACARWACPASTSRSPAARTIWSIRACPPSSSSSIATAAGRAASSSPLDAVRLSAEFRRVVEGGMDRMRAGAAAVARAVPAVEPGKYLQLDPATGGVRVGDQRDFWAGFLAGKLWMLQDHFADAELRRAAVLVTRWCAPLASEIEVDVGFVSQYAPAIGFEITGEAWMKEQALAGCRSLLENYNPALGIFMVWPPTQPKPKQVERIPRLIFEWETYIDVSSCGSVLWWARRFDARYGELIHRHQEAMSRLGLIQPDGRVHHLLGFDPATATPTRFHTAQGYDDDSQWTRAQGWGMNSSVFAFEATGEAQFFDAAVRTCDYFLERMLEPGEVVPYYDLEDPRRPDVPRDTCTTTLALNAMVRLIERRPELETRYAAFVERAIGELLERHVTEEGSSSTAAGATCGATPPSA